MPGRNPYSLAIVLGALCAGAGCVGQIGEPRHPGPTSSAGFDGGGPASIDAGIPPPLDEQFPASLLQPYTGPPVVYYDNTFINYPQLKNKVQAIFGDSWIRDGGDQFQANIGSFGGVDFVTHFVESTQATPDFLLALDSLVTDVCGQAVSRKAGPFAGFDPTVTPAPAAAAAQVDALYRALLYRLPQGTESTDTQTLLTDLLALGVTPASAWSGVCEALVRHPDFLFTLPPSRATATGDDRARLLLVKLSQDLAARPPTPAEMAQFVDGGTSLGQMADQYLAGTDFRNYFFYKMRIRTESDGTVDGDEPARLWTFLLTQHRPFQQVLTGDYSVDPTFSAVSRDPSHGTTGVLTMKGYLLHKQGLPHYNYSARVLADFMGYIFEVPASVVAMRLGATAASTVDPTSICYGCHYLLTPLAYQRTRWDDQGNYLTVDASGNPIDDSDHNLAPDYPFKGTGMSAFATQAVRKELFLRHTFDAVMGLTVGRPMRYQTDERVLYKQLWDANLASSGDLATLFKNVVLSPTYQGP